MHKKSENSGAVDLAQLHSTMRTIELACNSIQMHLNPSEAEATILSLARSPRPYQACQFILENSQVANARFQAADAIRGAALREWGILTAFDKQNLISFCLNYAIRHASCEGYVQSKVSSVAVQLLKRYWLDFIGPEREAFFHKAKEAITGSHGLDAQSAGINFLEVLVSEFSPSTSTAMGLAREFHEQCRKSLELDYLKVFYCWAQEAAASVAKKIIESDCARPETKVCSMALRLMLQILNWDFQYSTKAAERIGRSIDVFSAGIKFNCSSPYRLDITIVQPGPSWRDVLLSSGHIGWILSLYGALRQKFSCDGYWLDCPIADSARKLIVQFCTLAGAVFPSDNGCTQRKHLLHLLSGIIQWIDPPNTVFEAIRSGRSESEMLDGCRALLAIASVTTPVAFDALLKSTRSYGTVSFLSSLMCEVVKDLSIKDAIEGTSSWVARDILLDTWTAILVPLHSNANVISLPQEGINAAANLFALIVESELKVASTKASDDDLESDYYQVSVIAMDERLSTYALIGRAVIDFSIPLVTRLFSDRCGRLHEGIGKSDPTATMEELYSLLLIAGHVLADEGQGETPEVPMVIQTHFRETQQMDKHPVVILSGSIIKFAEQSLNPELRTSHFSPRLMQAVIWFLARWSCTYLLVPVECEISNPIADLSHQQKGQPAYPLLGFFGEHNQGKIILDIIVRVSITALVSYPGEKDLQEAACYQLLDGLVRRRNVCAHLVALDSWCELASAFANEHNLFSLHGHHQRSLAQTLVLSASGIKDVEASNQYIGNLMGRITNHLVQLSKKNDFMSIALQPDVMLLVSCLLERLRGAANASEPRTQKAIYLMGFTVMNSILVLLEAYKHESAVIYLLLKFVVDWVDGQIVYLEPHETAVVVNFCLRILQLYSSQNMGKMSLGLSANLLSEANTEKYRDLRALLQLLSNLCSKDLVDFSSESIESCGTNISEVVYIGLHTVLPLITLDLLKYPKLCHDYFWLLSHMLEVYPEKVAQLNSEAFADVLGTLEFGLKHQDTEVVDMCLSALKTLASYHYKETSVGKVGLGPHAAGCRNVNGKAQEGILNRFLRLLLQFLLFEDYQTDLVGAAADALFPLILCEPDLYQRMGNELIERQPNLAYKSRLANALQSLTSSNNLSFVLDRPNHQRFRKNLQSFLMEVRGFLRTI